MSNRFSGICYRCGLPIPPGDGVFEKTRRKDKRFPGRVLPKWFTQHHACAKQWVGTAQHYQWNDLRQEAENGQG